MADCRINYLPVARESFLKPTAFGIALLSGRLSFLSALN